MADQVSDAALDTIFREAHTQSKWLARPVSDELLREIYDLAKLGPTSANSSPMRVVFVKSPEAKERLRPALSPANEKKTMAAPVCAIVASDTHFYELLPKLWPHNLGFAQLFTKPGSEDFTRVHILRNGSLAGAYLIIAARAMGLDAGPMSGFDNAKVDAAFFPDGRWKSNFLLNLGYGDPAGIHPRNPRLSFEEACRIE
jgi:3-hydroxypropanoate dehydrogenase